MSSSKGVDFYSYSSTDSFEVDYYKPAKGGSSKKATMSSLDVINHDNFQVSKDERSAGNEVVPVRWQVLDHHSNPATTVTSASVGIDPDGDAATGDMTSMLQTPTQFTNTCTVCSGFYDASTGMYGLTNQDQLYVYVTGNYAQWMGEMSNAANVPFNRFVLAGAHDAGMYDATLLTTFCSEYSTRTVLLMELGLAIGGINLAAFTTLMGPLSADQTRRALVNFAFTQKESVSNLLNIGIRYFDFRPGYCFDKLRDYDGGLYHQHLAVPGVSYAVFLRELLSWLQAHPSEIVVLALGFAGFADDDMRPGADVLAQYLADAQQDTGTTNLQLGDRHDLTTTYGQLIQQNRRLLLLNQTGEGYHDATKYDSYSDKSYKTTSVQPILKALDGMKADKQTSADYTVLQLQGTVTGTFAGEEGAIVTLSDDTSPLLSTKPSFDQATYAWVLQNGSRFRSDKLLVLLNDFADNALVRRSRQLTHTRLS